MTHSSLSFSFLARFACDIPQDEVDTICREIEFSSSWPWRFYIDVVRLHVGASIVLRNQPVTPSTPYSLTLIPSLFRSPLVSVSFSFFCCFSRLRLFPFGSFPSFTASPLIFQCSLSSFSLIIFSHRIFSLLLLFYHSFRSHSSRLIFLRISISYILSFLMRSRFALLSLDSPFSDASASSFIL